MADQTFLTPQELSERWKGRITPKTLDNWRSQGKGPKATRIGVRVLYALTDVVAWEKAQAAQDAAPET